MAETEKTVLWAIGCTKCVQKRPGTLSRTPPPEIYLIDQPKNDRVGRNKVGYSGVLFSFLFRESQSDRTYNQEMNDLPTEWRDIAKTLIKKHAARGWKDIRVGLPDYSNGSIPSIFAYGTPPVGERVYCIVTQDASGFEALDRFFDSRYEHAGNRRGSST